MQMGVQYASKRRPVIDARTKSVPIIGPGEQNEVESGPLNGE